MIRVIRVRRIYSDKYNSCPDALPAGAIYEFEGGDECSECCTFMWGRDIKNYLVFRNGYPVELDSDLYEFERRLEAYE